MDLATVVTPDTPGTLLFSFISFFILTAASITQADGVARFILTVAIFLVSVSVICITLAVLAGRLAAKYLQKTSTWKGAMLGLNLGCWAIAGNIVIAYLHVPQGALGDVTAWTLGALFTFTSTVVAPIILVAKSRDRY